MVCYFALGWVWIKICVHGKGERSQGYGNRDGTDGICVVVGCGPCVTTRNYGVRVLLGGGWFGLGQATSSSYHFYAAHWQSCLPWCSGCGGVCAYALVPADSIDCAILNPIQFICVIQKLGPGG